MDAAGQVSPQVNRAEIGTGIDDEASGRANLALFAVLLFAFAVRLGMVALGRVGVVDEIIYGELGHQLLTNGIFTIPHFEIFRWVHVPGFPFILGLLAPLFDNPEGPATTLYVIFGSLLVLPVYGIGRRLYGMRAGLYAAILVAVIPQLVSYVFRWFYGSLTEPSFNFLVFAGLYYMLRAYEDRSKSAALFAGLLLGLSYMIRVEGVIYCGIFGLWLFWRFLRDREVLKPEPMAILAIAASAMMIFIAPYVLWLHGETGRWLLTGKSVAVFAFYEGGTTNSDPREFQKNLAVLNADKTAVGQAIDIRKAEVPGLIEYMAEDPGRIVKFTVTNYMGALTQAFSHKVFPPYLLPFVGLGLIGAGVWSKRRIEREAFLALSFVPVGLLIANLWVERYFSPVIPTLAIWAGAGLAVLDRWWSEQTDAQSKGLARSAMDALRYVPHILLVGMLVGICLMRPIHSKRAGMDPWEYKQAADWIERNLPEAAEAKIMAQVPQVPWYLGAEYVPTPYAPWADVLAFIRNTGTDYLVVDDYSIAQGPEDRKALLDATVERAELALVREWERFGRKVLLYRIVKEALPGATEGT